MLRLQDDDLLDKKEGLSLRIEFDELISQRILDLCNNRNITPHRLAALSELSPPTLDRLTKGEVVNPTFLPLLSIAMGLNIKLSCLLDFKGQSNYFS